MYLKSLPLQYLSEREKIGQTASLEARNLISYQTFQNSLLLLVLLTPTLQLAFLLPCFCSIASVRITQGVEISGLPQLFCLRQQIGSGLCVQGSWDPLWGDVPLPPTHSGVEDAAYQVLGIRQQPLQTNLSQIAGKW